MLARSSIRAVGQFCRILSSCSYVSNHNVKCSDKWSIVSNHLVDVHFACPVFSAPVRLKSKTKSKSKTTQISRSQIPEDVLNFINEKDMVDEFSEAVNRFQSNLHQRLSLRLTPQMLFDIHIPDANVSLGQVANLVLQNPGNLDKNAASVGDQHLLVDLSGRPNLMASARKAVANFLDPSKDGSGQSRIQTCGPSAFTVRLNTIVTQEIRQQMIARGQELFNQTIRELDRIYQSHDKLIHSNSEAKRKFSEDHLFTTREYMRSLVKQQHALIASIWQQKQVELQGA